MRDDTGETISDTHRGAQPPVSLIGRVAEEARIDESAAVMAIAMAYEHVARGLYALNDEPRVDEIVTGMRVAAAKLRASVIPVNRPLVSVLDAFKDWS